MKFLKFDEDDKLFNVDLKLFSQFKNKLDETEKDTFLIMYGTQGRTFWLQFILTFRYNYYRDHFITEIESYKSHCVFSIIEVVESIFINIHKQYLEDGCDPLRLLETITKYVYLSSKFITRMMNEYEEKRSIAYGSKDVEVIKDLIGDFKSYDKTLFAKCVVASRCYARFFMCIYNLLQKYKLAEEVSKSSMKNNPSKQYWQPFSIWNNENFMPSFFEKYLVSHYNKKLQNMLSLPQTAFKIFESRQIDHFCSVSENIEPAESEINNDRLVYRRKHCTKHRDCWEKMIHVQKCENPYNCSSCLLICDTILLQKINEMGKEAFWWNCSVDHYSSVGIGKGHRDALIQTDSLITSTEKYICVDSAKVHFYVSKKIKKSSDFSHMVPCLPAETQSTYDQLKRDFIVKYRINKKFDRKEEANDDVITKEHVNPLFSKATKCVDDKAALNSKNEYSKNYAYLFFIIPFLRTNTSPVFLRKPSVMSGHKRDVGVNCDILTHQQALKANEPAKSRARCNSVFSYVYEGYKKFFPKEKCMKDQSCSNSKPISKNKVIRKKNACTNMDEQSLNSVTNIDRNEDSQDAASGTINSPFTPNEIIATLRLIKNLETDDNAVCMSLPSKQTSKNYGIDMSEDTMDDTMENQKLEDFFAMLKANRKDKEKKSMNGEEENAISASLLDPALHERLCSYCRLIEVQKKSFKKCAQCKKENFQPMHYYCSKECQREDWMESHKKDHFPN